MTKLGRPRLELDVEAMSRDYRSGLALHAVAERHGCVMDTAWRRLREAGVQLRPEGGRPGSRIDMTLAVEAYKAGASMSEAAALVGRGRASLSSELRRRGEAVRRPGKGPESDYSEAIALYQAGMTAQQVGWRLGISKTTVKNALKRQGLPVRGRGILTPGKQQARIERLHQRAEGKGPDAQKARYKLRRLGLLE